MNTTKTIFVSALMTSEASILGMPKVYGRIAILVNMLVKPTHCACASRKAERIKTNCLSSRSTATQEKTHRLGNDESITEFYFVPHPSAIQLHHDKRHPDDH